MKRLVISSTLLLLIISGSLLGLYNIHTTKDYVIYRIDNIIREIEDDITPSVEQIDEAITKWEDNVSYMKFYLSRERIMMVSSTLAYIRGLIISENDQVLAECMSLKKQLDAIYATQLPKLENIF